MRVLTPEPPVGIGRYRDSAGVHGLSSPPMLYSPVDGMPMAMHANPSPPIHGMVGRCVSSLWAGCAARVMTERGVPPNLAAGIHPRW